MLDKLVEPMQQWYKKRSPPRAVENMVCIRVPLEFKSARNFPNPSIAVICHMFYPDLMDEFKRYLSNIPFSFDLYLTTDTEDKKQQLQNKLENWKKGKIEVRIVPNRGRDIGPKLIACHDVYHRYEYILHLHSKKNLDTAREGWRHYLLETLLGSEEIVRSIFEMFKIEKTLGMVAPQHYEVVKPWINWATNFAIAKQFVHRMGFEIMEHKPIDFSSGSMFWARSAAFQPLLKSGLSFDEFAIENNQIDGTLAHAIERLYFFSCEFSGYKWIKIVSPAVYSQPLQCQKVKSEHNLKLLINTNQYKLLELS